MITHRDPTAHGDALIRWAFLYDLGLTVFGRRGNRWRRGLADTLALTPGERVLDVGSGTGRLAFVLADLVTPGGSVEGVDAAAEMVAQAQRNNRRRTQPVTFRTGRAQALPFPDGHFDALTCTLALHHVAADDRAAAVAEMRRVLRPGGRVLIAEFESAEGGLTPLGHFYARHADHAHALDEAVELLSQAGFTGVTRGTTSIKGIGQVLATRPED